MRFARYHIYKKQRSTHLTDDGALPVQRQLQDAVHLGHHHHPNAELLRLSHDQPVGEALKHVGIDEFDRIAGRLRRQGVSAHPCAHVLADLKATMHVPTT